jgi:hypothetical protein
MYIYMYVVYAVYVRILEDEGFDLCVALFYVKLVEAQNTKLSFCFFVFSYAMM